MSMCLYLYFSARVVLIIQRQFGTSKETLEECQLAAEWGTEVPAAYLKIKTLLKNAVQQLFRLFTKPEAYLGLFNNHLCKKSITESEAQLMKVQQTKKTQI